MVGFLAAARILGKRTKPYLPGCLPWSPVLRSWPALRRQNDVGEFLQHLLLSAAPQAYHGAWQSRTSNPLTVEDRGPLSAPILIDMRGDTLQALIDAWSCQPAIHAIESHSGLVILQLKRYSNPEGVPTKNSAPVFVQPGEPLAVPVFASPDSLELLHRQFRVAFVIYHHGVSPHGGHYQAALSMPLNSNLDGEWQFYICDDGIVPKRAASADLHDILHNAYLIGLVRGAAPHCC